jgi:hypothetical protein
MGVTRRRRGNATPPRRTGGRSAREGAGSGRRSERAGLGMGPVGRGGGGRTPPTSAACRSPQARTPSACWLRRGEVRVMLRLGASSPSRGCRGGSRPTSGEDALDWGESYPADRTWVPMRSWLCTRHFQHAAPTPVTRHPTPDPPGPRCANHSPQREESGMLPTCRSGTYQRRDRSRAPMRRAPVTTPEERAPCVFQAEPCPLRVWRPR